MKTETVYCPECDHEHTCPVESDEMDTWIEYPEVCEACGEDTFSGPSTDAREDFHSDV